MNQTIYDMPDAEYRKAPGLSQTELKIFARSPAHLQAYRQDKPEPTRAMLLGRIVHQVCFTPGAEIDWVVRPDGLDGRSKEGREWAANNDGKTVITSDEWQMVTGIYQALSDHPTAHQALGNGKAEVSCFAVHFTGVQRKARIDFVNSGNALVDLKTVEDATPESFARQVWNLKYYMQAAYYLDIWNDLNPSERKDCFCFVAVEKAPPFGIMVYNLRGESIDRGRVEYERLLARYRECEESNRWPCYPEEPITLSLPKWTDYIS